MNKEKRILIYNGRPKWYIGSAVFALVGFFIAAFYLFQHSALFQKRYIFVDGGAHTGETIANFEKSNLYSKHLWEIFSFEANPNLIPHFPKKPNLIVLNKAIWIHDEGVNFYLGKDRLGSSILKHKKTGELSRIPTRVESVDFGQWLRRNFKLKDFIIVKLDIEGAEYEVLDKMLLDGSIKYVDALYVEFHNIKVGIPPQKDKELIGKIEALDIPVRGPLSGIEGDWFK